jgi:hypothetical protein
MLEQGTRQSISKSNCYWERKSQLYIMHGERSTIRIPKMLGSYILLGCYILNA